MASAMLVGDKDIGNMIGKRYGPRHLHETGHEAPVHLYVHGSISLPFIFSRQETRYTRVRTKDGENHLGKVHKLQIVDLELQP